MTFYKYDTHVHTSETSPCGVVSASQLVPMYRDAGYQGVVITDHYYGEIFNRQQHKSWDSRIDSYLSGYRLALEEGSRVGLDVILGMEICFDENDNDYLVYGIDEDFLKENKELYSLGLAEFRKLISGTGIFIAQAHPFRPAMIPADPKLLDGVEVYNGNKRHNSSNHLAMAYARDNGLIKLSGSDFHQVEDFARGGILLGHRVNDSKELARLLHAGDIQGLLETE